MFQFFFMMMNPFNILFLWILYLIAKQFHFDIAESEKLTCDQCLLFQFCNVAKLAIIHKLI